MLRVGPIQQMPKQVLSLAGFPLGLNTSLSAHQLSPKEAAALINFTVKKGGALVTRDVINAYSSSATINNAAIIRIAYVTIGGTSYVLLQDANYKVYYLDSGRNPVHIGDLSSFAEFVSYNDICVVLDGDYIKYIEDLSGFKIAYDDGLGTTGYQFDYTGSPSGGTIALGNGTNSRVATKFTSQAWTPGYTIPPTTMSAYLKKAGSPAGTITMTVRRVSDDSIIASKTFIEDVSTIDGTTPTLYSAEFGPTDITTEMSPNTEYYASLEYTGGDGANYIEVSCEDVPSGGTSYYYTTSWINNATHNPRMALKPGEPPKGSFAAIKSNRLFVAGDPDNPGYVWFSNLTHLDWSTPNGGGYIGVVDNNKNSFAVGGLCTLYGDLLIYGTQDQPYLSRLVGTEPANYSVALSFQKPWTTHRTLLNVGNDVWAGSGDGVDPISGVREYGDLRTFSASDPIFDKIINYWDSDTAFAAYYPKEGQYWLVMPKYHRVLVCHTKLPTDDPHGQGARYPWTEYEFYRDDLTGSNYQWTANGEEYYLEAAGGGDPHITTKPDFLTLDGAVIVQGTAGSLNDQEWDYALDPTSTFYTVYYKDNRGNPNTTGVEIRSILLPTAICSAGESFLLGGSDGYVYYVDHNGYKDLNTIQIKPKLATAYVDVPFGYVNFTQYQLIANSTSGGQVGIDFYVDGKRATAVATLSMAVSDGLTVDQAIMDVDDAYFSMEIEQAKLFQDINFNGRSIMVVLKDIFSSGEPIYINGILLKYRRLSY